MHEPDDSPDCSQFCSQAHRCRPSRDTLSTDRPRTSHDLGPTAVDVLPALCKARVTGWGTTGAQAAVKHRRKPSEDGRRERPYRHARRGLPRSVVYRSNPLQRLTALPFPDRSCADLHPRKPMRTHAAPATSQSVNTPTSPTDGSAKSVRRPVGTTRSCASAFIHRRYARIPDVAK
jgi:hypothetical protein